METKGDNAIVLCTENTMWKALHSFGIDAVEDRLTI